jgi:hypothetical protein
MNQVEREYEPVVSSRQPGTAAAARPFGVTAIAFIQVVTSASALAGWWASGPFDAGYGDRAVYLNSAAVAVALLGLIVAAGLLLMVRWAWPLILFVLSIQLAVGLWAYYHDHPNFVTMALSVVAIFYLNSRDVRGAFGYIRPRESVPIE